MHFGQLLKRFREERQLTLRDLGKLSEVNHAYVHRLETGEKSAPSAATITVLMKALRLDSRQAHVLRFLVAEDAPDGLVEIVLDEPEHALADFASLVALSRHGARPKTTEDWRRLLGMLRRIREEL